MGNTIGLAAHFRTFQDRISLSKENEARIKGALVRLDTALENHRLLSGNLKKVFVQGSFACNTIVQPANSQKDFDIDVVLVGDFLDLPPSEAICQVERALKADPFYSGRLRRHRDRCIRIAYARQLHIDLVVTRPMPGGSLADATDNTWNELEIATRFNAWEPTNPLGLVRWVEKQDHLTGGDFTKSMRMLKAWRDHRTMMSEHLPSIVLTVLLSELVPTSRRVYSSLSDEVLMYQIFSGLSQRVEKDSLFLKQVENPIDPRENLARRIDSDYLPHIRKEIMAARDTAALAVTSHRTCHWQKLFGRRFPADVR